MLTGRPTWKSAPALPQGGPVRTAGVGSVRLSVPARTSPGSKGRCVSISEERQPAELLAWITVRPLCGKLSWISAASSGPMCAVRSALSFLPLSPLCLIILLHGIVTGAAAQVTARWSSGTHLHGARGNEECTSRGMGRPGRTSGLYKGMWI
ncbi:hypothetical protein D623_10007526 [Myotis brandtii]|uniref:Uncharacterized protein n=2 Tax=Myotis brandtii TaxID=109478 RepID=S7P3A4_MYOBR|nr:hypothetical protein D623_10007526 [Myotis brandtii]